MMSCDVSATANRNRKRHLPCDGAGVGAARFGPGRPGPRKVVHTPRSGGRPFWVAVLRLGVDEQPSSPLLPNARGKPLGRNARFELGLRDVVQPTPSTQRLAISRTIQGHSRRWKQMLFRLEKSLRSRNDFA